MPMIRDEVKIDSFNGVDANRDIDENENYAEGVKAENLGRTTRRPLTARPGLRPTDSSNDATEQRRMLSIGAFPQGARLSVLMRLTGGVIAVAKDVVAAY